MFYIWHGCIYGMGRRVSRRIPDRVRAEPESVQVAVFAAAGVLQRFGPQLHRPQVDTLKGSSYPNMKELRITLPDGEWRVAFAFDPKRKAILLTVVASPGSIKSCFTRS